MKEWEDKYLLGIKEIDEQHSGFFSLVKDNLNRIEKPEPEQLGSIINNMEEYLKNHFNTEEELLEKSGYPDFENHKKQHSFFIQKIEIMKLELDYDNLFVYEKLIDFMKKWFLSHIIQTDKKYREVVSSFLQDKQL